MTYRETLLGMLSRARTADKKAELEAELALPEFPEELRYLWRAFLDIRRRKGGGGWGPEPIGYADLLAYSQVTGVNLRPWEHGVVFDLDDLWMASVSDDTDRE